MTIVLIAHQGMPCDPPTVDGVTFVAAEEGLWIARVTEEQAAEFTRNPRYTRFGGKAPETPAMESARMERVEEVPLQTASKSRPRKG